MDPALSTSVAQLSRTLMTVDELALFQADPISGPYGVGSCDTITHTSAASPRGLLLVLSSSTHIGFFGLALTDSISEPVTSSGGPRFCCWR